MNDCPNAEMRDRLPDLMHERLEASMRDIVVEHVADCTDCQEELALLRTVRGALTSRAPSVNIAAIVSALPKPVQSATRAGSHSPSRWKWTDWRVAAAVTLFVVGGSSIALVNLTNGNTSFTSPPSAVSVSSPAAPHSTASVAPAVPESIVASTVVAADGAPATAGAVSDADKNTDARLAGLSNDQLKALLGDLDNLEALPVADAEPVSIRVNSSTKPDGAW